MSTFPTDVNTSTIDSNDSYKRVEWKNGETKLNQDNLNIMDVGLNNIDEYTQKLKTVLKDEIQARKSDIESLLNANLVIDCGEVSLN